MQSRRVPAYRRLEIFEVATARWRETNHLDEQGGYRLEGYGVSYGLRVPGALPGTMLVTDARLVRYGAALLSDQPLAAYWADRAALEVPLGADLPGLYGRAAVLASGWLPRRSEDGRGLLYRDVPASIAAALIERLET
jgi:hypothetical protein